VVTVHPDSHAAVCGPEEEKEEEEEEDVSTTFLLNR
jgi:hypothetical protein